MARREGLQLNRKAACPGVTPSVIACGDATFPKGTAFSGGGKVSGTTQRRPLGGAGERSETEGVFLSYSPVFVHKLVTELCKRKWRGGMGICLW